MNDATLTSWSKTLGVRVEERRLAGDRCGIYYDPLRLIIIDERLAGFQRRCTLCHELIHARHHDPGCGSQYGVKCERRCRRETALALISPVDYGMAEEIYGGAAWRAYRALYPFGFLIKNDPGHPHTASAGVKNMWEEAP